MVGHSHRDISHAPIVGTAVLLPYIILFLPIYVALGILLLRAVPFLGVQVVLRWPSIYLGLTSENENVFICSILVGILNTGIVQGQSVKYGANLYLYTKYSVFLQIA